MEFNAARGRVILLGSKLEHKVGKNIDFMTNCAISGKEMKISDDVVIFPYFDSQPGEPEFICCESAALRNEFERWYLKDKVIQKVRDFWVQRTHEKRFLLILAENENFLIVTSTIEKGVSLFFLNHVFSIDFTIDAWERFVDLMRTAEKGDINTIEKNSLYWDAATKKGSAFLQIRATRKDSITIRINEWLNLQELLSVSR